MTTMFRKIGTWTYLMSFVLWLSLTYTIYRCRRVVLAEERELVNRFGKRYIEYRKRVPRFFYTGQELKRDGH